MRESAQNQIDYPVRLLLGNSANSVINTDIMLVPAAKQGKNSVACMPGLVDIVRLPEPEDS